MAALYARRTLVVYRVYLREPRKKDRVYRIDDIDGRDYFDILSDYCSSSNNLIQIGGSERFLRIGNCRVNRDLALVGMQSGRAGIGGAIVNTRTSTESYGYGSDEAGMVNSRAIFYRKAGLGYALACIERVPNDAGSTPLLVSLKDHLKDCGVKAVLEYEQIKQEEALKAFKGIEDIEVRRYARSSDISEGLLTESRYVSHIARHKPRRLFPFAVLEDLHDRKSRSAWLGIPEEYDGKEEVRMTLRGYDGSSRTYVLGDDIRVPLVEMLNDTGVRPLTDSEICDRCRNLCDFLSIDLGRMI